MNKIDYGKLKAGSIISEVQHYKILPHGEWQMENGETIVISRAYVSRAEMYSADQYTSEEKVTKTKLAQLVLDNPNKAMSINYNKILKIEDEKKKLKSVLQGLYANKRGRVISESDYNTKVDKAIKDFTLKGEERTIRGRHYCSFDNTDTYLKFIDMDAEKDSSKDYDTRGRLVNLRELNWIIINNIKYIRK